MSTNWTRRKWLAGLAGCVVSAPGLARSLLEPTPRQAEGPFYPIDLPLDDDNDLTRVAESGGQAKGQPTDLYGRIVDVNGRPIVGTKIEIWQCDANGRYHHPHDTRAREIDPHFQGYGQTTADDEGRYRFRTIRPVAYPGRTPHIHIGVIPPGGERLVTQLYVADEPRNRDDFLFNMVPADKRHRVVAQFVGGGSAEIPFSARFDIVLGGGQGTPSA